MPTEVDSPDWIYHLALRDEWGESVESGNPYSRSTLGKSLAEEGFIHCSFARQVETIADLIYRGRRDVVLQVIDPSVVNAEIRIENLQGGDEKFPHIYGDLPSASVVRGEPVPWRANGTFDLSGLT